MSAKKLQEDVVAFQDSRIYTDGSLRLMVMTAMKDDWWIFMT